MLLSIPGILSAQNVLRSELNLPRTDDRLVKEQVNFCQPEAAEENPIWDFGNIQWINDYSVHYFSRDKAGLIGSENGTLFHYHFSGDSLLLLGYENATNLVRYQEPALLLKFPLTYGISSESVFRGRGKHEDRLESVITGTLHVRADASGSLVLPGNDTLSVLRVHIRKVENGYYSPVSPAFDIEKPLEEDFFSDSSRIRNPDVILTDTYQWYEEGYRYPILESIESYRSIAGKPVLLRQESYFYHPEEQVHSLFPDTANGAVLERKRAEREAKDLLKAGNLRSLICHPNPVKDQLEVEFSISRTSRVQLKLVDLQGRLIYRTPERERLGQEREIIDMSAFPKGNYLLTVYAGGEKVSQTIVKR
jgi:hypothetical protein